MRSALDEEAWPMRTPEDMRHHYAPNVYDPSWWMPDFDISGA